MYVVRMPFGKHRGEPLGDIPAQYLRWVLLNCFDLDPYLSEAIEWELQQRPDPRRSVRRPRNRPSEQDSIASIIRQWHREMALEFHPDRGGSNEAMKAINRAKDRLEELLGAKAAG